MPILFKLVPKHVSWYPLASPSGKFQVNVKGQGHKLVDSFFKGWCIAYLLRLSSDSVQTGTKTCLVAPASLSQKNVYIKVKGQGHGLIGHFFKGGVPHSFLRLPSDSVSDRYQKHVTWHQLALTSYTYFRSMSKVKVRTRRRLLRLGYSMTFSVFLSIPFKPAPKHVLWHQL